MAARAASLSGTPEGGRRIVPANAPAGFRMSIGAGLDEVAKVNATLSHFAEVHALPAGVRRSMNVVLDELLTNTVSYGLAGRDDGKVTIDAELRRDRLTITLSDNGRAFDPFGRDAPDTTLGVEARPIGGLGIHLVGQLLDEASYHRRGEENIVVLVKRLPPSEQRVIAEGG